MTPLKEQTPNPWISIWFAPRATLKYIVTLDCLPLLIVFGITYGALSGFTSMWFSYFQFSERETFFNFWLLFLWSIGGAVYGILYLYIGSWLYKVTGRWIGGKGEIWPMRCALGWSMYPATVSSMLYLIGIIFSRLLFVPFIFMLLSVVIGVWGFILLLQMLGEAHGFSAWRALFSLLIAAAIVLAVFLIISIIILLPITLTA